MHDGVVIVFDTVFQLVWVFLAIVVALLVFVPAVPLDLSREAGRVPEAESAPRVVMNGVKRAT